MAALPTATSFAPARQAPAAEEGGFEQLMTDAEQASLTSLSNDLGSLLASRGSSGDVVFTFPAEEGGLEDRAHRCAPGLPHPPPARRGSRAADAPRRRFC